jgi:hypothetical protein
MERSASRPAARPHQGAIANTCDKSRRYRHVAIWRTRQSELPLLVLRTGASGAGGLQNHAISAFHCFPTWPAPAQPVVRCHLLCQEGTVGPEGALRRTIEPHLNPAPRARFNSQLRVLRPTGRESSLVAPRARIQQNGAQQNGAERHRGALPHLRGARPHAPQVPARVFPMKARAPHPRGVGIIPRGVVPR